MAKARTDGKVLIVGSYRGAHNRWAIGRALDEGRAGPYVIGSFVSDGGIVFYKDRLYTSRENAEAHLLYDLDASVKI